MTAESGSLEALRRQIDAIDDEMHDLLMRRAGVVERIATVKHREGNDSYVRPAREARILRRLAARHRGRLPFAVVVRMWREMVSATSRLQGPFSVAVFAPEARIGYWDLARDQYGSAAPMTLHEVAGGVIRAVADRSATVGVLPLPRDTADDPWWPQLIALGDGGPRVIALLPFVDGARPEGLGAMAIARVEPGDSGDDVSLIGVEADADMSRAMLTDIFAAAGLAVDDIDVWRQAEDAESRLHLARVKGFVAADDARLADVAAHGGVRRTIGLGGYAVPLGPAGGG